MSAYLFIMIFIIGNFMIPTESVELAQNDNNIMPITVGEFDTFGIVDLFGPAFNIHDRNNEVMVVGDFCSVFPPIECFESDTPDELKNDVELFQEQFCPNRRIFNCIEEFARRCLSSTQQYYDFIQIFLFKSRAVLKLNLCSKGPYEEDDLRQADCLRFTKTMYNGNCPLKLEDGRNNVTSVDETLVNYVNCVNNFAKLTCGDDTDLLLRKYTNAYNISAHGDDSNLLPRP